MPMEREMPKYKCHKVVHAVKLHTLQEEEDGSGILEPHDFAYQKFSVSKEYMDKHDPQCGGYYVVYEDGYESYSPAEAFEAGYTLIES